MPYCVRCGVELDSNISVCPLCHTPVIDPETLKPVEKRENRMATFTGVNTREISEMLNQPVIHRIPKWMTLFFTGTLLLAVIFTLLIDILSNNTITWSFYPILSALYIWLALVFPFMLKAGNRLGFLANFNAATIIYIFLIDGFIPPVSWAWYPVISLMLLTIIIVTPAYFGKRYAFPIIMIYYAGISLFLWALERLLTGSWFLPLALPILSLVCGGALIMNSVSAGIMKTRKWDDTYDKGYLASSLVIVIAAGMAVGIDAICTRYIPTRAAMGWSFITGGALVLIAAFLLIAAFNERLKMFLTKKFHA